MSIDRRLPPRSIAPRQDRRPAAGSGRSPAAGVLDLQRGAGNRAVRDLLATARDGGGLVELPLEGTHPVAAGMARTDAHARVPTFADLKAAYTDRKLKIPEAVIKEKVAQLLGRMQREGRLKSSDPVATIIAKIFPGPGRISEAEFKKALDTTDRQTIYKSVLDADTTVKKVDKAKLKVAMKDARDLIATVERDAAGLTAVFGSKAGVAKARYAAARAALADAAANLDKRVSTDYNLDDPEVFLGGWAVQGHMHLLIGIVKVVNPAETKATLIHEAAHQADGSVDDLGYYATPGFEAMTEDEKVNNAAHYEELPRRVLGTSSFVGHTFTPGTKVGGGAVTWEDQVHRIASEHLRKAWDAAVDSHMLLREVRKARLRGDRRPFDDQRALILEISQVADLTIHAQDHRHARVTSLDMTLIESVARAMMLISDLAAAEAVPTGPYSDTGAAEHVVEAATAGYGRLLGDAAKDKAVVTWFHDHYKAVL